MPSNDPKITALLSQTKWRAERKALRAIVLDCDLTETVKWGKLCYTFNGSNVAIIYGLKDYFAIGFFKGTLIDDTHGVLRKPGENSQSSRWIEFTTMTDITEMEAIVRAYIGQAIANETAGLKVDFKARHALVFPEELRAAFAKDRALGRAFDALTPGRQRGYNLHFTAPKQSKTRIARIEKCRQDILDGKGLHDR